MEYNLSIPNMVSERVFRDRRRQFAPASLSPVPVLAAAAIFGLLLILVSISFISVLWCRC
jgi:hypothetical protein